MAEAPDPVRRTDLYLTAAMLAHETVWELHKALATVGLNDDRTRELVRRSAEVATAEIPQALGEAFRLREEWSEQDLLDTSAAIETLRLLTAELERIEPEVACLRAEQNGIARDLRDLVEGRSK
jgi:hypothetical protein